MHSDWFIGTDILQCRWQHGEKVAYCYPSGLDKTLCKWDIYVPLVMKGLRETYDYTIMLSLSCMSYFCHLLVYLILFIQRGINTKIQKLTLLTV
jgi:hypothetical protein